MRRDDGYPVINHSKAAGRCGGMRSVSIRDEVLAAGITINGLPIMLSRPYGTGTDIPNLDVYYEDCVTGGPGSFVVAIKEREQFKEATRTKLVQEIAGVPTKPRIVPVQARSRVYCY